MRKLFVSMVVASLVAVACGKEAGNQGAEASLANSVAKTLDTGSAKFSLDFGISGVPGAGGEILFGGSGEVDLAGGRSRFTMELPSFLGGGLAGDMEIIADGSVVYLRAPFLAGALGAKTPWIKLDVSKIGNLGALASFSGGGNDPSQMLSYLRGVSSDVSVVGHEEVRGVETTHYRGTVDIRKAIEMATGEAQDQVKQALDQIEQQLGTAEFPIDVWVDGDGLTRRMQFEVKVPSSVGGGGVTSRFTMDLYDFGEPVDIEPPPASQVTDITETLPSGLGG